MSFVITNTQIPEFTADESDEVVVPVEVLPLPINNSWAKEYKARFTLNAAGVALRRARWRAPANGTGVDCSFTLADPADRTLITEDSSIKFEVAEVISGVTYWKTIVDLAHLSQTDFNVGEGDFSFETISGVDDRLSLTPPHPLVIYDPARVPFDETELKAIRDTNGFAYTPEAIAVPGLTLFDLFEEIFVNRCGFTAYDAVGLKDFAVRQANWEFTTKYIDGLAPHIGEYDVLIFEYNDTLYVRDLTQYNPSGFPAPRELTVHAVGNWSYTAPRTDADGALMNFSVPDVFDYKTHRNEFKSTEEVVNGQTIVIEERKLIAEFRSKNAPQMILKEETAQQITDMLESNTWVQKETLKNLFDRYGRLSQSFTTVDEYVEDLGAATGRVLQHSEGTETNIDYAQHPHSLGRQYQKKLRRDEYGLIMQDTANSYRGAAFQQAMKIADLSGNLEEGQTSTYGLIRTYTETGYPLPGGKVEQVEMAFNWVRDKVEFRRTAERTGDISLNGQHSHAARMIVYEEPEGVRGSRSLTRRNNVLFALRPELVEKSATRLLEFYVGEIPLEDAIALVRRKLKRLQTGNKQGTFAMIGLDLNVRRGSTFTAKDANGQLEGTFVCEGYEAEMEMTDEGWDASMSIQAVQI